MYILHISSLFFFCVCVCCLCGVVSGWGFYAESRLSPWLCAATLQQLIKWERERGEKEWSTGQSGQFSSEHLYPAHHAAPACLNPRPHHQWSGNKVTCFKLPGPHMHSPSGLHQPTLASLTFSCLYGHCALLWIFDSSPEQMSDSATLGIIAPQLFPANSVG